MYDQSLLDNISTHPLIIKLINDLTFNQLYGDKLGVKKKEISKEDIRKAVWLVSILSGSDQDEHRNRCQILASLLFLQYPGDETLARAIYVLFSRIGNLTGAMLLKHGPTNYFELTSDQILSTLPYDSSLLLELELERAKRTIESSNEQIVTTKFQKDLWEQLEENDRTIISAPTSSGKSFIIKKFLKTKLKDVLSYTAVYIVPSRALLNQVSEDLRNEVDLQHVSIKTVFNIDEDKDLEHRIFVLTPERCLRILKYYWNEKFKIDFVFIDEIQNVEDVQGRGALFEFVFKELFNAFPAAKLVVAGPNIENPNALFEFVFGPNGKAVQTTVSPVFQIKTTIRPLPEKRLEIILSTVQGTSQSFLLRTEFDYLRGFNANIGEGLKHLINLCGRDQQNIIYSPKGNWAADWALKFASTVEQNDAIDPWLMEIIEFLIDEIHPKYHLIPCLSKGVAYHHGNLPDIVRKEIEDLFLDGKIKNLFCTSTLLQGVNLPANNLFIPMPKKRHIDLTPFDFGNLIGRAGRIRDSLYGTIFCIERKEEEPWSEKLYGASHMKKVLTAGEKSLQNLEVLLRELEKDSREIQDQADRSAVVFFRQKYAQSSREFREYLNKNSLSESEIEKVEELVRSSVAALAVPADLLRLNPTIDPVLQNILYIQIQEQGARNWMIPSRSDNENMFRFISLEEKENLPFESWSFHWQLADIIERLDSIFHMTSEAYFKHGVSISVKQVCFYARKWLNGSSLRNLIDSDIKFYSNHHNEEKKIDPNNNVQVNDRINDVIKINAIVTTHILITYLKLMNDLLDPFLTDELKERYKFSLALPSMLELGTTEPVVVSLISRGVSRTIALKIFREFKRVPGHDDLNVLQWLQSQKELGLKPIYNRYLRRMRLLKTF